MLDSDFVFLGRFLLGFLDLGFYISILFGICVFFSERRRGVASGGDSGGRGEFNKFDKHDAHCADTTSYNY